MNRIIWLTLFSLASCGSARTPAPPPPSPPQPPRVEPSPCDGVTVQSMTTTNAPAVPVPPDGRTRGDPDEGSRAEFVGWVADRLVVISPGPSVIASVYDPTTDTWKRVEGFRVPTQRVDRVEVKVAGPHVVVGWSARSPTRILEWVDLDVTTGKLRELPTAGGPASLNSIFAFAGGALFVWPGDPWQYPPPIDYTHGARFDYAAGRWSALPDTGVPATRSDAMVAVAGDRVFVWGGMAGKKLLADGAVFNAAKRAWSAIPTAHAPTARRGSQIFHWQDQILVWGGATGETTSQSTDSAVYDLAGNRWIPATNAQALPVSTGLPMDISIVQSGPYVTAMVFRGESIGFDFTTDGWSKLPASPNEHPVRLIGLGGRGAAYIGTIAGGKTPGPQLVALDLVTKTWCTQELADAAVLRSERPALVWSGSPAGAWGAVEPVEHPGCPPGAPCKAYAPSYTTSTIGSLVRF